MGFHKNLSGDDIHTLIAFTYANAAARLAASGILAADIGKAARQTDDNSLWILSNNSPLTWDRLSNETDSATASIASLAYGIAVAGTDAAHEADSWARDAYGIAVNGTNAANAAWDYAGQAWLIATNGTDAAHEADQWARDAYAIAVAGTATAAAAQGGVNATDVTARVALNLAATGTNAANEADSWARDAFGIAVNGTNAANAANSYAGQAWTIAVAGTSAINATDVTANVALSTSWVGTNAANSADSWARDAYSLAVAGTNAAAAALAQAVSALSQAQAVYSLAIAALTTAWAGTSAYFCIDQMQNYDTTPAEPNASAPLTNTQIAGGTNWFGFATFNGTSAPYAQFGFSGTSSGWPTDSFEQYNTGTVITGVTISQGTGWTGPAYIY